MNQPSTSLFKRGQLNLADAIASEGVCTFGLHITKTAPELFERYDYRGRIVINDITTYIDSLLQDPDKYAIFATPDLDIHLLAPKSVEGTGYLLDVYTFSACIKAYTIMKSMATNGGFPLTGSSYFHYIAKAFSRDDAWNFSNGIIDVQNKSIIGGVDQKLITPLNSIESDAVNAIAKWKGISTHAIPIDHRLQEQAFRHALHHLRRVFFPETERILL